MGNGNPCKSDLQKDQSLSDQCLRSFDNVVSLFSIIRRACATRDRRGDWLHSCEKPLVWVTSESSSTVSSKIESFPLKTCSFDVRYWRWLIQGTTSRESQHGVLFLFAYTYHHGRSFAFSPMYIVLIIPAGYAALLFAAFHPSVV